MHTTLHRPPAGGGCSYRASGGFLCINLQHHRKFMRRTILGLVAAAGVWAAVQAQPTPGTPPATSNRPAATAATNLPPAGPIPIRSVRVPPPTNVPPQPQQQQLSPEAQILMIELNRLLRQGAPPLPPGTNPPPIPKFGIVNPLPAPTPSSFQMRLQEIVRTAAAAYFSRLDAMESRLGGAIIRRSTRVGSISGNGRVDVTCIAIAFRDTRTNLTEYGIKIEVSGGSRSAETRFAHVDYEDIDPLLKGMDSMSRMDMAAAPFRDFEAAYTTISGLRIAVTPTRAGKFEVSVQAGRDRTTSGVSVQAERDPSTSTTARLTSAQFDKFRGLLESAKTTLDSARKDKER